MYKDEKDIIKIIKTVAKALEYLHSHKIVHRDLRPSNILFKTQGGIKVWKLADFTASKMKNFKYLTTVRFNYTA